MTLRFYYNRRGALPWSIDYGTQDSELHVKAIHLADCNAESRYNPTQDPERPAAWFEVSEAGLVVVDGEAFIRSIPPGRIVES